jgi:NAD(P)-dependent dehydrogenase (short-subunit alcohol dehydrogenase family)
MLDLADQRSVAAFVQAWDEPLHLLVNNAGIMGSSEHRTPEGWEPQFAANHLGHFALAHGLHGALAAAGRHGGARIVVVSSSGHLFSPVVFDDVHFAYRPYDPLLAYAQSRTANVLFAVGATARWAGEGITANALHPGASGSNLQRWAAGQLTVAPELRKTPQQGAATSLLLATSPLLEGVGGRYFNDCNEAVVVDHRPSELAERFRSVAVYALDPDAADRLWETSLCLTRLAG